jgi:hypothetical protein
MAEEHQSIMKNEVWEIVPRPKEKSVVTSKWVYKIKHAADGSMDKYKARFMARRFSLKEEKTMMKHLLRWQGIPPSELSYLLSLPWDGIYTKWMSQRNY